jgi:hypothetical protein
MTTTQVKILINFSRLTGPTIPTNDCGKRVEDTNCECPLRILRNHVVGYSHFVNLVSVL